jgi:hypothetical protein
MEDKKILYQMVERYIDNIMAKGNPMFALFSQPIKKWIFNFIDPYVNAFLVSSEEGFEINTQAASAFVKSEISDKIEDFMKKFEAEKNSYGDRQ